MIIKYKYMKVKGKITKESRNKVLIKPNKL